VAQSRPSQMKSTPASVLVAVAFVALVLPALVSAPAQSDRGQIIKLSENLDAVVPAPWEILRKQTRGLDELVLPEASKDGPPVKTYLAISTEWRGDHAHALQRLKKIEEERKGAVSYMDVCGWPAMERRSLVELPQVMREEHVRKPETSTVIQTTVVTIVVTVDDSVVRYEATLNPKALMADADEVLAVAGKLRCSTHAPAGQTERELKTLRSKAKPISKSKPVYSRDVRDLELTKRIGPKAVALPPIRKVKISPLVRPLGGAGAAKLTASEVSPNSFGELQIAVSSNAQNVLIAANSGMWFSVDGGATYSPSANIPWVFNVDGDPSVGVGQSGNFYYATIGMAGLAAPPAACTNVVAVSQDGGNNFTPTGPATSNATGAAAFCAATGNSACFPDQEQMAVDRNFVATSGDQLYMVWRNFRPTPGSTSNRCELAGGPLNPMISCSMDGGKTWIHQTSVGTGDIGRVTVGPDGFVYVTYVNGSTLYINKFDQCQNNLKPQTPVFPVSLPGGFTGVGCPVPGLDRCSPPGDASPQPSVDDTDPLHVMVALAQGEGPNSPGPENVVVFDSHDGGQTWPRYWIVNNSASAVRFLPWICTTQGDTYVSWYDRRNATADDPSRTAYYVTAVDLRGPLNPPGSATVIGVSPEINVSNADDPQCASGWPFGADSINNALSCPSSAPKLAGTCQDSSGTGSGSLAVCTPTSACTVAGEGCVPNAGNGAPKYGDYNGNACMNGSVYLAWASGTSPAGVPSGSISIYTDRLSSACGGAHQACCTDSALSVCRGPGVGCVSNTCQTCAGSTIPNADHSACVAAPASQNHGPLGCPNGTDTNVSTGACCPSGRHGPYCTLACGTGEVWNPNTKKCCDKKYDNACTTILQ
jgi:hypothetical protein